MTSTGSPKDYKYVLSRPDTNSYFSFANHVVDVRQKIHRGLERQFSVNVAYMGIILLFKLHIFLHCYCHTERIRETKFLNISQHLLHVANCSIQ